METKLTEVVRKVWPEASALAGEARNASGRAIRHKLPVTDDIDLTLVFDSDTIRSSPYIYAANTVDRINPESTHWVGSVHFSDIYYSLDDRKTLRTILAHQLIEVISTVLNSGRIQVSGFDQTLHPGLLLSEIEELWSPPDSAECGSVGIEIVDSAILVALREQPKLLYDLRPREFEEFIAELLRRKGYKIEITPESRDGGKDIIAVGEDIFGEHKIIVECKRYAPDNRVGIEIVQRLFGVQEDLRATRGLIATSSYFTSPAIEFANGHRERLTLWDFWKIRQLLNELG